MRLYIRCTVISGLLTLAGSLAVAQAPTGADELSPPTGNLLCRLLPTNLADSAAFVFEYVDGDDSVSQRVSLAAFDQRGAPLYMLVHAPKGAAANRRLDVLAIQFVPKTQGGRVIFAEASTAPRSPAANLNSSASSGLYEETLTDAELTRAKLLAEWFWVRRCAAGAVRGTDYNRVPPKPL